MEIKEVKNEIKKRINLIEKRLEVKQKDNWLRYFDGAWNALNGLMKWIQNKEQISSTNQDEKLERARKLMINWCEKTNKKINLTPDNALEIFECIADLTRQTNDIVDQSELLVCQCSTNNIGEVINGVTYCKDCGNPKIYYVNSAR